MNFYSSKSPFNVVALLESKRYRLVYHALFWIYIEVDMVLALFGITEPIVIPIWRMVLIILLEMVVVYFNVYILGTRLRKKENEWEYIYLSFLVLILGAIMVQLLYFGFVDIHISAFIHDFINLSLVTATAIAIKFLKYLFLNQKKFRELEMFTLKAEINFLKEQMNPHFLFNSLNNIYVQTRKAPDDASESILLLSDLLRYQLYECQKKRVDLVQEIDYLRSYMQLHLLRKYNLKLDFDVKGDIAKKRIAPFVFQPFVENAIKHGLSVAKDSFLNIAFKADSDKINFTISNSKVDEPSLKNAVGGIGLANVKRRLELIYPDNHLLNIKNAKKVFSVDLTIYTSNYE